jgi:Flp pilus assembly protein TadG
VVEASLVLPVVLLFMLGIFEFGRWFMMVHTFNNAASTACSYAAKHTSSLTVGGPTYGSATSDVQAQATNCLAGHSLGGQTINVYRSDSTGNYLGTWNSAQPGQFICVEITGTFSFMIPTFLKLPYSSMSTSFKSVKRSEGN